MSTANSVWTERNEGNFKELKMCSFEKAKVKHLKFEISFPFETITKLNIQSDISKWPNENILMSPILPSISKKE